MFRPIFGSIALVASFGLADAAQAVLISGDFIRTQAGVTSAPVSGDTTPAGIVQNNSGTIFTGQVGAWNGVNIAPSNAASYPGGFFGGFLNDGNGAPTTVRFNILPHPPGTLGPNGLNQAAAYRGGLSAIAGFNTSPNLRFEFASINNVVATNTLSFMNWQFTGLDINAGYELILFGGVKEAPNDNPLVTMIGNGVAGVRDAEGDFNWTGLSNASGQININIALPQPITGSLQSRYFGFQLQSAAAAAVLPEPATLTLGALGLAALLRRQRRTA